MTIIRRILLVLLALCALPALAHKASDSYLQLKVNGVEVAGQWDIALRDIDFAIGLDANGDGDITWREVRAKHTDISAWALGRLSLQRGGHCSLQVSEHLVDKHTDGAYAVMRLAGTCPEASDELTLHYRLLFDQD
ncbi:MAG: HupE/UreJ family protein, partial [Polaromonas sp.]